MNPVPRTDAAPFRAGRHIGGNLERGLEEPRAHVVYGENCEILRLNIVDIRLVSDSNGTTCNIRLVVCVDRSSGLSWTGEV